jgi:alpha-tubulin suppressor-like RCC1 family protein
VSVWGIKQVKKGQPSVIRKPEQILDQDGGSVEYFAIAAADYRAAGVDALGRVWLWNNITMSNPGDTLQLIDGLKDVVSITVDSAVKMYGSVWSWTKTKKGQFVPFQVSGIKNAIMISKGKGTHYVLLKDGHVLSWGDNRFGQAGLGVKNETIDTPRQVVAPNK